MANQILGMLHGVLYGKGLRFGKLSPDGRVIATMIGKHADRIPFMGPQIHDHAMAVAKVPAYKYYWDAELLVDVHIAAYDPASLQNHEPRRRRKLLLHRREIDRLRGRVQEKGYTVVPTRVYLKDGRAKVEIALARGKRQYDKRETIAKRDAKRQVERAIKERTR